MGRGRLVLLLALVAVLAGCGSSGSGGRGTGGTTVPTAAGLDGRTFLSQSVTSGGQPKALIGGSQAIRLSFEPGRLSVSAGCNILGGSYRLEAGELRLDQISSTAMGCDEPHMVQDEWLSAFLQAAPTVTQDGDTLVLSGGTTVIRFLDRRVADPDVALEGRTWTVDTLIEHAGASSVPVGVTAPTVTFGADGRAVVFDGCNTAGGPFETTTDTLTVTFTTRTNALCPGGSDVASLVAATFAGPVAYRIEASRLTLMNGDVGLGLRS